MEKERGAVRGLQPDEHQGLMKMYCANEGEGREATIIWEHRTRREMRYKTK